MIKKAVGCIVLLFALSTLAQEPSEEFWIDVRSPKEYQQQHLDEAVNIPFMDIAQRITDVTKDKQALIHLYCTDGSRAKIAKQILDSSGFENVVNEIGLNDIKTAAQ